MSCTRIKAEGKMRINEFGTFGICLDEHSADTFKGRLFVSVFENALTFKSLNGLLSEMGKALEEAGNPRPFFEYRTFSEKKKVEAKSSKKSDGHVKHFDHGRYSGELATFLVNILYRQNATWQGTVTWVEGDKSVNFRSALELFVLIESVFCDTRETPG